MSNRIQGSRLAEKIVARLTPLAEWTRKFKPDQRHLTLARDDYDTLKRWEYASRMHGIDVIGESRELWFKGLELTYDGGPKRYPLKRGVLQTDLAEQFPGSPPAPS